MNTNTKEGIIVHKASRDMAKYLPIVQWYSVCHSSLMDSHSAQTNTPQCLVRMGLTGFTIVMPLKDLKTVFDHKSCWKSFQQIWCQKMFVWQLAVTNTGFFKYKKGTMVSFHGPNWLSCDQTLLQFELRLTFFGSRLPSQGSLKKFRKRGSFGCKTVYMRYWGPDFLALKFLRMQPS